jgi:hypothetical protein
MYPIVTFILFLLIVTRFFYIRIKYPFWAHMSVYHTYDYHRIIFKTNREIEVFPQKNKFTNPVQIKTIPFYDLNETYIKYFAELLQCFYIPDDTILSTFVERDIKAIMNGHFAPAFVSFYNEKNFLPSSKASTRTFDLLSTSVEIGLFPEPKGCIASYPVRIFYHTKGENISANYLTFVSCHREYKDKHISRNLIATHEYNARKLNPNVRVGLLKKEAGICEGVVPLCEFRTCLFRIGVGKFAKRFGGRRNVIQVYKQNWSYMMDLLFLLQNPNALFEMVISIDIGAVKTRVDSENLFVFAFCEGGHAMAMYFVEDAHMLFENTTIKTLRLLASINNGLSPQTFQQGFVECLRRLVKKNGDFKALLMDDVGHNLQIMEIMKQDNKKFEVHAETAGGYYFINWLFLNNVNKENIFILL